MKIIRPLGISAWSALVLLLLFACRTFHIASEEPSSVRIDSSASNSASDSEVEKLITPYKASLDMEMNEVIGHAAKEMIKDRPESTLSNWVADAVLDYAEHFTGRNFDIGMSNYGGLRISSLPAGAITRGKVYELMPFDNYLVVLTLDGEILRKLFVRIADSGGWPISRGVQLVIKDDLPWEILLDDKPIDDKRLYTVVISDYVANGGNGCDFLKDQQQEDLGVLFRDALIEIVKWHEARGEKVQAKVEGRITMAN
ncbi:MAG: 5'-nucleotidase C-terminal domain-containing protein [Saprospiraceae bacterium]|nr:5'-nucleotidase C-terminal domain-containing protein [Saprospiraceae bacterium]